MNKERIGMKVSTYSYLPSEKQFKTLGFSPFELLFGREVCGSLKLLKESWLDEDDQVSLVDQVSKLHHRKTRAGELSRANLEVSQKR